MYFLPRNNKFFSFVVHLKSNYRYGLTVASCGMVVLIWMLAVHMPLQYSINHTDKEIKQLQSQFLLCDQANGSCLSLATTIESMKIEVKKQTEDEVQSAQNAMLFLVEQAHKNNLHVKNCAIEADADQKWYIEHAITVDMSGEFNQLMKFFDAIKNSTHLVAVKQFNLTRNDEGFNLKGVLGVIEVK